MVPPNLSDYPNPNPYDLEVCYQIAFCHWLGFGTAKNHEEFKKWLARSQRTDEEFKASIELMTSGIPPSLGVLWYHPHTNFSKWHSEGYLSYLQRGQYYREQERLEEAQTVLTREIDDWESVLGGQHPLVMSMLAILCQLMIDLGDWRKCQSLALRGLGRELIEDSEGCFQLKDIKPYSSMASLLAHLANSYMRHGEFKKAEAVQRAIVKHNEQEIGPRHLTTLNSIGSLAVIQFEQGQTKKATRLLEGTLKDYFRTLGEGHVTTLTVMMNLCRMYTECRQFTKAEDLCLQIIQRSNKVLGQENIQTLLAEIQLSKIRFSQRKYLNLIGQRKDGELKYGLIEKCESILGDNHPFTLEVIYDTARSLFYKRYPDKAMAMMAKVVERAAQRAGEEATETAAYRDALKYLQHWCKGEERGNSLMTFDLGKYVITTKYHPPRNLRQVFWIFYEKATREQSNEVTS